MDSEDGEIFCQDDFMSQSFGAFEDMKRKEELVDFKINFKGRSLTGHRLVLAARIPHFRQIFCSSQQEVTLNEVDPDALESVINFAYTGKIEITHGNVESLLSASKVLQLTKVYGACWEFLQKRFNPNNVLEVRRLAEHYGSSQLLETCDLYIKENFEEFTSSESFLTIPFLQLQEIIAGDDVKVSREEKVFEAVIRWVKAFPSERKDFLPELLSSVRMCFLTPDYLTERVGTEEFVRSSLRCRDVVELAKSYHLLPDKRSKFCGLISRPRLYDVQSLSSCLPSRSGHNKVHSLSPGGNPCRMLLCCVCISGNGVTSIKLFDRENKTWLNLSSFHSSPSIDAAALLDGAIYIFSSLSVQTFDIYTCKWNFESYLNQVRGSGSVLCNDRIYFFGGIEKESAVVRSFDPRMQKFRLESCMPRPLESPGVAHISSSKETSSDRSIFITGGRFERNVYNTVALYNPEAKQWTEVSSMKYGRHSHGCCDLNEKIYVCGGQGYNNQLLQVVEVYDPLTNQWTLVSRMRFGNHMSSVISDEEEESLILASKGSIEMYDSRNNKWKKYVNIDDVNTTRVSLVKSTVACDTYERILSKIRTGNV